VTNCDGPRFLLEAIHTLLQAKDRLHFDTAFAEPAAPLEEAMATPAKCQILVVDGSTTTLVSVGVLQCR
jgi:hypothetical protein